MINTETKEWVAEMPGSFSLERLGVPLRVVLADIVRAKGRVCLL